VVGRHLVASKCIVSCRGVGCLIRNGVSCASLDPDAPESVCGGAQPEA
jgi:hypothetical protein